MGGPSASSPFLAIHQDGATSLTIEVVGVTLPTWPRYRRDAPPAVTCRRGQANELRRHPRTAAELEPRPYLFCLAFDAVRLCGPKALLACCNPSVCSSDSFRPLAIFDFDQRRLYIWQSATDAKMLTTEGRPIGPLPSTPHSQDLSHRVQDYAMRMSAGDGHGQASGSRPTATR
jgi:hypothetical protein